MVSWRKWHLSAASGEKRRWRWRQWRRAGAKSAWSAGGGAGAQ